jgi:hypothetical protein
VARVEQNLGQKPAQVVVDGGFTSRENIVAMAEQGVDLIGSLGEANQHTAGLNILRRSSLRISVSGSGPKKQARASV